MSARGKEGKEEEKTYPSNIISLNLLGNLSRIIRSGDLLVELLDSRLSEGSLLLRFENFSICVDDSLFILKASAVVPHTTEQKGEVEGRGERDEP